MRQRLAREMLIWGVTCAMAGVIAGAALGAVLSGGDFIPWTLLGLISGLFGGAAGGIILRLLLEVIWQIGATIAAVLKPKRDPL